MDKKIANLVEAFEHCKFEDCLRMSTEVLKKMDKPDPKKKQQISETDINSLYLSRIGSLAATGQIHEANQLMQEKYPNAIISEEFSFLFLQIASLSMDKRLSEFVQTIWEKKENKKIEIGRFILLSRKFSTLSQVFLKRFVMEKNRRDSFAQIYLEYLQQLNNQKMIKYSKDKTIIENKNLNLNFVSMFLDKFVTSFKSAEIPKERFEANVHRKMDKGIIDLKFKMAIHSANAETCRKIIAEQANELKDNIFIYLRSLKNLSVEKEQNFVVWSKEFLSIFKANMNLDNYQPIYDFSVEYINGLIELSGSDGMIEKLVTIPNDELYTFKENPKEQLLNYVLSLYSEYQYLKENENQNKNKDYYKISLKNSLLLSIYILAKVNAISLVQDLIIEFKQLFGKKLTFPDEIQPYLNRIDIFTSELSEKLHQNEEKTGNGEDWLIGLINTERIFCKNPCQFTLQENLQEWQRIHELYEKNVKEIEFEKKLEKGERYLSDEFITIYADSIRKFTEESSSITDLEREELYFLVLGHLESAVLKSPYNHDLKLRAIFFYNKLNYFEDTLRTLESLDIKAVQFETLGFFHLKNIIAFGAWGSNEQLICRIVRSYQENIRECSEYAYKALIANSFNECEENICYGEHIVRSYNFIIYLYVLYLKNYGKDNSDFYLREILDRIQNMETNKITFNADFRVMKNVIDPNGPHFVDFYGIYNSHTILKTECLIKLLLNLHHTTQSPEELLLIRKSVSLVTDPSEIYNFQQYEYVHSKLEYKYSNEKVQHEKTSALQLSLMNKLYAIALAVFDFVFKLKNSGEYKEEEAKQIKEQAQEFGQTLSGLTWRLQTLFLPSLRIFISQVIPLLSTQIDIYNAKKKKEELQAQKKLSCQEISETLIESVTDLVKMQERLKISKEYYRENLINKDNMIERMTKMNSNEFKKIFKIKL